MGDLSKRVLQQLQTWKARGYVPKFVVKVPIRHAKLSSALSPMLPPAVTPAGQFNAKARPLAPHLPPMADHSTVQ